MKANNPSAAIRGSRTDLIFDIVNFIVMGLAFLIVAYPLYFVVIASVSDPNLVNSGQVVLYPRGISWDGYQRIFSLPKVWLGYRNTLLYTVVGTAISVCLTITGGYALSRHSLPGRNAFMGLFTFTMFFNGGMIPTYLIVRQMNMLDTIWAMTLPGAVSIWNLIIARTFFKENISDELVEAGELDGCNQLQFFAKIALPLTKALVAIMILYYMVGYWNAYFNGIIYLKSQSKYPLQLILRDILIADSNPEMVADISDRIAKQKMAELLKYGVIVISTLPLIAAYPFVQKFFIKGVMIGSLKG